MKCHLTRRFLSVCSNYHLTDLAARARSVSDAVPVTLVSEEPRSGLHLFPPPLSRIIFLLSEHEQRLVATQKEQNKRNVKESNRRPRRGSQRKKESR